MIACYFLKEVQRQTTTEARQNYINQINWEIAQKEAQLATERDKLRLHLEAELALREAAEQKALDKAEAAWERYLKKLEKSQEKKLIKWVNKNQKYGKKAGKKWSKAFTQAIKNEIDGIDIGGGIATTSANGKRVVMSIKAYERQNGAGWRR